ncbi:MAG: PKD domain-containing protein, partial [Elusimicrobia bacterium]|nr:PKD domain-containing protein [Elusimicrobiota bacterium]
SYSGADGYYGFSSSGFDYGITPPDPIAIATADRYSLTVGETVSFDGSQSYVPNLDATITAYRWSFGDGGADGNGATASHSYDNPGNYTVTLTVTDSAGNSGTDSFQVVVGNVLPPINLTSSAPTKYSLEFQWQPGDAYDTEGFVVDFDEGDGSNLSCATGFDIGYSAAAAYSGLKSNTTYSFLICAYNEAGRYSVGRLMTVRTAAPLPVTMAASQFGTNYMKIAFTAREAGRRYQLMSRPTLSPGASWQPVAGALVTSTTLNEPLGFIVPESLAQQQMFFSVVSQ